MSSKKVHIGRIEKERSLEAPIINALITTASALAIPLPRSFLVPYKQQRRSAGLSPEKLFTQHSLQYLRMALCEHHLISIR